jgi:hypothetical protein
MSVERSWTNPFSNHTALAAVDVRENLEALVGLGSTPPALLLPLLHEATHHWCFLSPVGNTIALIKARARERALLLAADLDENGYSSPVGDEDNSFLLDLVICKVATEALRPFGEGLAIAAELDSLTRKSIFLSGPFLSAARAFALPVDATSPTAFATLDGALVTARKEPAGIRRRLNVYADRIGPDGHGYLLGYLAVRWMMRQLGSKETRLLEETDLIIGFLRSFFYDDLQLVDLLLERDTDYISLASAIMRYLDSRIRALCDVTPDDVREFEIRASAEGNWNQPRDDPSYSSLLHYDAQLARRGIARVKQLVADMNERSDFRNGTWVQGAAQLLRGLDAELLNTRYLVNLGTCTVHLRVHDGKCAVSIDGKTILQDVATTLADIDEPGTIDVCYSTKSRTQDRLIVIAKSDEVVAVVAYGPGSGEELQFPEISMSRSSLRDQIGVFDKGLDSVARVEYGPALSEIDAKTPTRVEALYLDAALDNVPDQQLEETLAALRTGGLRAVLSGSYDLAEALAVIGAVCGAAPLRAVAEGELRNRNLSAGLLDELLDLSARRIPLVSSHENWLFPLV